MNDNDPDATMKLPDPGTPPSAGELLARALNTPGPSIGDGRWTPPAPEELAALLPQYEIESLLGYGGMGAVYKGRQAALDRPVAIKLLPAEMAADAQFIARFQREARTLAKLQHPGIVAVHDFGQTSEGHLYFVMEFVDGTDLHRILHAPGGLNPAQALELISQICDALHYAHGKGVIHRDIKPGNILVTTDSRAKLADFGLARPIKEESTMLTGTNVVMGTAAYMAPEQQEGRSDQRADIYALGVMLYEMLCGQRPSGAFDPPSHRVQVDVRLDDVVIKAMQQQPERRYQQVSEMKTDVDRIRTTPEQRKPAPKPKSKSRIAAIVALCLALASAAGFVVWKKAHQPGEADQGSAAESSPALQRVEPSSASGRPDGLKPPTTLPAPTASIADILTSPDYEWSAPENLGQNVNSKYREFGMALSDDGLNLVFSSSRSGREDLFECRRTSTDGPFGKAVPVMELNGPEIESEPFLSADGLKLLFQANHGPDHQGNHDIYQSRRSNRNAPWGAPVNLGPDVNTDRDECWPCLSRDGLTLLLGANWPGKGGFHPFRSRRNSVDGSFGTAELLETGVGKNAGEQFPRIVANDGTMLFARMDANAGSSAAKIFLAVPDAKGVFTSQALNLPVAGGVTSPWLAPDGRTLYFSSDCAGGFGDFDLWQIRRVPKATTVSPAPTASPVSPSPGSHVPKSSPLPATATKDAPFVNTLGMKFVPVPITGGPTGGQRVLFSVWETRVQDYEAFATEAKREWPKPPYQQGPTHPAVMINWNDAQAFCAWLTERERKAGKLTVAEAYRLPSDHEWSCAVGIGDREDPAKRPAEKSDNFPDTFPWGGAWPPPKDAGNYSGEEAVGHSVFVGQRTMAGYRDDFPTSAPVGSFAANRFGIFDLGGNANEWCEEWFDADQTKRVTRGTTFGIEQRSYLLSSKRSSYEPNKRGNSYGFRVVLAPVTTTPPAAAATVSPSPSLPVSKSATPATATKDAPYVNTLGMKFVPVPITGGPTGGQRVLFSVWETRVQDFGVFAKETKREWPKPDFEQGPAHPAVNVSSGDAQEFCKWLTKRERSAKRLSPSESYRLPTDYEWSCAVGIGDREDFSMTPEEKSQKIADAFPWGAGWPPPARAGNYGGEEVIGHEVWAGQKFLARYRDDFPQTAPVGSFAANPWGIFDLGGNAWE